MTGLALRQKNGQFVCLTQSSRISNKNAMIEKCRTALMVLL
jgi:hypothetical protein